MAVAGTIDNLRAWRFVRTVREAQGMGPASLNELSRAIPSNGGRCLLATAMDCVTDNHVMVFPNGDIAKTVARATEMPRQAEVEVVLPDYMTDVAWAFDRQLCDFPLLLTNPVEFRRRELEKEFRDWRFDGQQVHEYVRFVQQLLGTQCSASVWLRTEASAGPSMGSYELGRMLGCPVHEPQPEYCPGGYAMVVMPEQAMLLCDVPGVDVDLTEAFDLDGCPRALDVPLPEFMNALAAALELGTLGPAGFELKATGQLSFDDLALKIVGGERDLYRGVLDAAA